MLATKVNTTADLMTIALQAEREAIRRYTQLAETMREGNNASAAALFERMVLEEAEHERLLLEWMAQENIRENPDIGPISWRDPQVSTTYDDEARDPDYSTPYRALAFAVHNEEIAFRFYTHVAADSDNKAVRDYAEVLAREELGHAALLRAERRRAYHAERETQITEPRLDPALIHSEVDLLTAAIHIDSNLANEMKQLANASPEIKALARDTQQKVKYFENTLSHKSIDDAVSPNEDILQNLQQLDLYNAQLLTDPDNTDARMQKLYACCDRSFAFYDAIVETTTDEAIMLTAQALTSSALDRIGVIKQMVSKP